MHSFAVVILNCLAISFFFFVLKYICLLDESKNRPKYWFKDEMLSGVCFEVHLLP